MPPSLQCKVDYKNKMATTLDTPKPLLLPVSESDVDQLWSQYCEISSMSLRSRRSQASSSVHMNYWAGTYEVDRTINVDVLVRSPGICVRLTAAGCEASKMPVYLPNMAVPLELFPDDLFADIDTDVTLEVFDVAGHHLGNCVLGVVWKNSEEEPALNANFVHSAQVCAEAQNKGNSIGMKISENESFRKCGGARSFELLLY